MLTRWNDGFVVTSISGVGPIITTLIAAVVHVTAGLAVLVAARSLDRFVADMTRRAALRKAPRLKTRNIA